MSLSSIDKNLIWHPYTHLKLGGDNIVIIKSEGIYLYAEGGKRYIDAVSSWWVNIHGHSHPYIAKKIYEQFLKLDQIIFAGFTHEPAVKLSKKILEKLPNNQSKIFYSDNGSTAVEVAIKMAIQYWNNIGSKKNKIIAFNNAFHGDTFGAMAVSERGVFTLPFHNMLFEVLFVDAPTQDNESDSLKKFQETLQAHENEIAAFVFEPLVQGAAGMQMHSAKILDNMIALCQKHSVITIADEVMTGFGRTGRFFACDYLDNKPDIFCLSKGLTGGVMPLGITACREEIYSAFYNDDKTKSFFHGHSFTGNPLSCAAALASLDIFENENVMSRIAEITELHKIFVNDVKKLKSVAGVRHTGTILAIDVECENPGYLNPLRDKIYNYFLDNGILLRPLGNTIYILPPYCITNEELSYIYNTIKEFLKSDSFV